MGGRERNRNDVVSNVRWMPRLKTVSLSRSSRRPIVAREPRAKIVEGKGGGREDRLRTTTTTTISPRQIGVADPSSANRGENDRAKWRRIVFADTERERERVFQRGGKSTCFPLWRLVGASFVAGGMCIGEDGEATLLFFFREEKGVSFRARYLEACAYAGCSRNHDKRSSGSLRWKCKLG